MGMAVIGLPYILAEFLIPTIIVVSICIGIYFIISSIPVKASFKVTRGYIWFKVLLTALIIATATYLSRQWHYKFVTLLRDFNLIGITHNLFGSWGG
jgi:membrane protein implicated in regulation of membrane protease activity